MQMRREDFRKQRRGPYSFDRWRWKHRVRTRLGDLAVELSTLDDDPTQPDEAIVALAEELAGFAQANGELLLDLIYGHYRYAEQEGWLEFWEVPSGLDRDGVLAEVESIELCVQRDVDERPPYEASVYVNPNWDREHKLELLYRKGKIAAVNGEPYALKRGVLHPR